MEGVFKRMKVLAFCAKFHEFLSICARALKRCSVVKDKRNDCLRSPILSASVSEFDGGVFAFTAQNSGAAEAPRTDGLEFLKFKAHSGCARGRRGGA